MSDPVKTPAPRSLAERAYLAIRDQLVMLDIAPGEPLNEDALARGLEVGRTPVREALKRLESERLVAVFPRRGTFATDVNIADLGHIFEVRHTLEPMAAAMAAERATAVERELLAALLEKLGGDVERTPSDALMRLDLDVHRAIYRSTGNPFLEDTLIRYDNLATRIWCVFLPRLKAMAGHIAEHRFLLQAVLDGDEDAARRTAASHVKDFETAIRAVL
ncbi:GntR family transcriptional regulator [Amycolatopsis minnesotensis]|uniref:GntR family transcriptional regulator n=1 Tax=Amycolatopsis minnesotensis TaxID=337894 RepID=A0ABP5CYP7_9PSEU